MRNYVRYLFGRIELTDPTVPITVQFLVMAMDSDDLQAKYEAYKTAVGPSYTDVTSETLGYRYVKLDRANLLALLATHTTDIFNLSDEFLYAAESPRGKPWTDEDGVKRKPPPSDRQTPARR